MENLPVENIYGHTKKLKFILQQIEYIKTKKQDLTILDFGCGNGSAVSKFLIAENIKYYGVDIHKPSLKYARQHFGSPNALFLSEMPTDIQFDIIVYADILEHLDNPLIYLQRHVEMLKPEGIIVGAVPNGFGPFEMEKRIDSIFGLTKMIEQAAKIKSIFFGKKSSNTILPYNFESGHLHFFSKKDLLSMFQNIGMEILNFQNGAFLGAPISELFLLRGKYIAKWNSAIANYLPYWAVSTWYFAAKKKTSIGHN